VSCCGRLIYTHNQLFLENMEKVAMEATFRYTIIAHSPILNNADRLNGQPKIGLFL
jgi:hypothetical protein